MVDLPIFEVRTPMAREYADLVGLHEDLKRVYSYLSFLEVNDNQSISEALFTASLISYRRCFSSGVRKPLTRDEIVSIGRNAHELHDYLYEQSNKLAAHSVNGFEEVRVGVVLHDDVVVGVAHLAGRLVRLDGDGIKQWKDLVMSIIKSLIIPKILQAIKIVENEAKSTPIDNVKSARILQYTALHPEMASKKRS